MLKEKGELSLILFFFVVKVIIKFIRKGISYNKIKVRRKVKKKKE
jgi:hypothetical protein